MTKRLILGIFLAVVASAITASAVVVVVGQQGGGQEPPEEMYIPPVKALKPGEVEIPPGTPVASLALPMDYGRFRIIPYGNVPDYTPDWLPPPGVQKVGMDINTSDSLDEFRDHDLFIEPPYIPAGWELTWAHAETVIWDDGSRRDSTFGLQYDRPEYFYIRIKRFHIAPEGQVELLAPPASAQDALILNDVRGVPAVFAYGGGLKVHFLIGNVLTRVEGVAIDFDELIKIADALIAHTEEPTAAAPAATPEPSPEPTALPTTAPSTRGALGCVDCPVKARDQLRVTAEDIRLGKDGKYYVPDRGDGCAYEQDTSTSWGLVLRAPGCEMFWVQVSEPGELKPVIP